MVAEAGYIAHDESERSAYAIQLRLTVAVSVGVAIVIGIFRILRGWPIHVMIIGGYVLVVIATAFAPPEIIGRVQEHIEWNDREMANALKRQARGEDTSKWETLDFPGWDEHGEKQ